MNEEILIVMRVILNEPGAKLVERQKVTFGPCVVYTLLASNYISTEPLSMNKVFLTVLTSVVASVSFGQEISKQWMIPAGEVYQDDGILIQWTLGETAVGVGKLPNLTVSQGLLQPLELRITQVEPEAYETPLLIYPAPATSHITLEWLKPQVGAIKYTLMNASGKVIHSSSSEKGSQRQQLDITSVTPGAYLLIIQGSKYSGRFKIIKAN